MSARGKLMSWPACWCLWWPTYLPAAPAVGAGSTIWWSTRRNPGSGLAPPAADTHDGQRNAGADRFRRAPSWTLVVRPLVGLINRSASLLPGEQHWSVEQMTTWAPVLKYSKLALFTLHAEEKQHPCYLLMHVQHCHLSLNLFQCHLC